MVSGDLAASAVTDALANSVPASTTYPARWKAEIGSDLEESVVFQRFFFADGARIDALVDGAPGESAMVRAVTGWAAGTASYRNFRRPLVAGIQSSASFLGLFS